MQIRWCAINHVGGLPDLSNMVGTAVISQKAFGVATSVIARCRSELSAFPFFESVNLEKTFTHGSISKMSEVLSLKPNLNGVVHWDIELCQAEGRKRHDPCW